MNWKKSGLIALLLLVLTLFLAACEQSEELTLEKLWDDILSIGMLEFLAILPGESALTGFLRLLIGILVFTILFEVTRLTGLSRNIGTTIAIILGIISMIFIPGTILAGIGASYGFIVALLLIGLPVAGCLYAFFTIPTTTRGWIALRVVVLLIALWILLAVKAHANELLAVAYP